MGDACHNLMLSDSWHIREKDVMPEPQRARGALGPFRSVWHRGGVIMCRTACRVGRRAGDHMISSNLRARKLAKRDRLGATQVWIVRVVLIPATELPWLQAYARVTLPPPIRFSIVVQVLLHAIANGPGYGNLAD